MLHIACGIEEVEVGKVIGGMPLTNQIHENIDIKPNFFLYIYNLFHMSK